MSGTTLVKKYDVAPNTQRYGSECWNSRSNHRRCSVKTGVLRNFAKFTGKHLFQSPFFNKVAASACNFIKKETLEQVFSYEFCEKKHYFFYLENITF